MSDAVPFAARLGATLACDASSADVLRALDEHLVVVLPGLAPSPEAFRDLAASFGPLEIHPYLTPVDDEVPEVVMLDASKTPAADIWHTDGTFSENPPIAALLHMVECPPSGGDTSWVNCYDAYDALSLPMQEFLTGLTCLHDDGGQGDRKAEHPVVREHPETGRRSLYVQNQFARRIPQLSRPESQMLLQFLFRWQEQLRFSCRWSWTPGDVVIWDERVTLHAVVDDLPSDATRILHRATVLGDEPKPPSGRRDWPRHSSDKTASSGYYGITNRSPEF